MYDKSYFFRPRLGQFYEEGLEGIRTLVVGVCHICSLECKFHDKCGSPESVWEMDRECPVYKDNPNDYYRLSNSNNIEILSFIDGNAQYPAYSAFTYYILKSTDELPKQKKEQLWEHVAFTNFLQLFHADDESLPKEKSLYEKSYSSFLEVVSECRPEVVYAWSPLVKECIIKHSDDFVYIGKADMAFQLSVFIFIPQKGGLKGNRLRNFCNKRGIQPQKHQITWYRALVAKHLGNTIPGDKKNRRNQCNGLAVELKNWVESKWLTETGDTLSFQGTEMKWTTVHIGLFAKALKEKYMLGRGANVGLSRIFNWDNIGKCSTDKRKLKPADRLLTKIEMLEKK